MSLINNIKEALKFYASKYNITNNKDIFMLDIGSNVGWYPSLLGDIIILFYVSKHLKGITTLQQKIIVI